jgi:hypothetical protein
MVTEMIDGIWRDLLVTSILMNAVLGTLVMWFRATILADLEDLSKRLSVAEQVRAEKAELKALSDRVAFISRDYASREDIERIGVKLDTLYALLVNQMRPHGHRED